MGPSAPASGHGTLELVEVAPRDGLQNEEVRLGTAQKVELVERAVQAGFARVEVTSFVHPERVPQMADAEDVVAALPPVDGVVYSALVLNRRGFERARAAGIRDVNFVLAVTEEFNRRNQGASVDESVAEAVEIAGLARAEGMWFTATLATAFGCPFEGEVGTDTTLAAAGKVLEGEPDELSVADTIGVAVPSQVTEVLAGLRAMAPATPLRCHFHNTRNTGMANALAALDSGPVTLDSSLGGIGGCPFAPRATGNVPTEDLVYMLQRMGYLKELSLGALIAGARWLGEALGRDVPGLLSRAGVFPPEA